MLPLKAAEKRQPPANWPESEYPAGEKLKDGRIGCRMEMKELLQKYKKEELMVKSSLEDAESHWGTYTVGDDVNFQAVVGPKANKYFGSVKHGRDGGHLDIRMYWMDREGKKVLNEGMKTIKAGC